MQSILYLLLTLCIILLPRGIPAQSAPDLLEGGESPEGYVDEGGAEAGEGGVYGDEGVVEGEETGGDPYALPEEEYTGTLAGDEDADNPDFERRKAEREAFEGGEELKDDEGNAAFEDDTPGYLLTFQFDSQVVFHDKDGQPFMEISYTTKIEHEVALVRRRWRDKGTATVETNIVGDLAGNELFTCKLDIMIDNFPVDLMTRFKHLAETEEMPEHYEVAAQLRIRKKGYTEQWYSNCTSTDGAFTFNTKGDPERYNLVIMEQAAPSINGMVLSDFDPDRGGEQQITVEPFETVDEELEETTTFTGEGTLRIEPLGGA